MSSELIVDTEDKYAEQDNVFYMPEAHVSKLSYVRPGTFSAATINVSNVDYLTPFVLSNLLTTLVVNAPVTVIIKQPVAVMQEYDANQVIANAKIAGFQFESDFDTKFTDNNGKSLETIGLKFSKPERIANFQNPKKITKVDNTPKSSKNQKRRK